MFTTTDERGHVRARAGRIMGAATAAVFGLILGILALTGMSLNRAEPNEWGCQYGGKLGESKALKNTVAPGKSGGLAYGDTFVAIPAGDRIYAIDNDPTTADFGGQPIVVPAKGTNAENNGIVPVIVPIQARFTINENACELYANYLKGKGDPDWNGTRTKEDGSADPGAWPRFLNLQMNQVLNTAARAQLGGKSYVDLYTDFSNYPTIQKAVSTTLTQSLIDSLGGQFFCGPSYQFDGNADGELDNCPPIEIVIKEIKPEDPIFLANLKTIVANQEQQVVIESDKDKAIAQATADKQKAIAQTAADKEKSLATTEADKEKALATTNAEKEKSLAATMAREETQLAATAAEKSVALAQALADGEVATAFSAVVATQTANDLVKKQVETAFCERLAATGVSCADYFKAQNWRPVTIIGADSTFTPLVNV